MNSEVTAAGDSTVIAEMLSPLLFRSIVSGRFVMVSLNVCANGLAQLCHHGVITVPSRWHSRFIPM